jgi:hypothetical protein
VLVLLLFLAVAVPTMALQQVDHLQASQSAESTTRSSPLHQMRTLSSVEAVSLTSRWSAVVVAVDRLCCQTTAVVVAVLAE